MYVIAPANASSNAIPQSNIGFDSTPIERNDVRSVRAANAVPTWQKTMARNVAVVASRYASWRGEPAAGRIAGAPARAYESEEERRHHEARRDETDEQPGAHEHRRVDDSL